MTKSMTGFAKIEIEAASGKLSGEARSLNSRYLEISMKLPKTDYSLEQRLREIAKRYVSRGKVDISIKWERPSDQAMPPKINENTVSQYIAIISTLKEKYHLRGNATIDTIMNFRDIFTFEENNSLPEEALLTTFEVLLQKLNEEKLREGQLIEQDLLKRLDTIVALLVEIEMRHPLTFKAHQEKLKEKVLELSEAVSVDEIRLLQEVAIYMERLDISEEIVRLRGHVDNFMKTLGSSESIGRKLDFIVQEMVRETNTIASKSNDLSINEKAIQIKVEIEKIREQVQNVE
jgi:uncharacterized protein (TIGR00255 family)